MTPNVELAVKLQRLACAENEKEFFDCVADNITAICIALNESSSETSQKIIDDNERLRSALKLIWAEVVASDNAKSTDFGWPKACAAVREALAHPFRRQALSNDEYLRRFRSQPDNGVMGVTEAAPEEAAATRDRVEALEKALSAAAGYLLNAKIDLETGAPKRTAIQTIEGGLKIVTAVLGAAEQRGGK